MYTSFNQDISSWDVSSADSMSYMFRNELEEISDEYLQAFDQSMFQ